MAFKGQFPEVSLSYELNKLKILSVLTKTKDKAREQNQINQ